MAKAEFFTVTESFVGSLGGAEVEYHKGDVVPSGDPALKKMPLHFEPLVLRRDHTRVEQATAAPGEKRHLSLKRKAKASKPAPEPEPEAPPAGKAITTSSLKGTP